MFLSPKFYIEQFQHTKQLVGDQILKDQPELKECANNYIEAQTRFAEMLVDNTIATYKYFWDQTAAMAKVAKVSKAK